MTPGVMRPAALVLNLFVACIGAVRFARAGFFSWRLFWPFALGSVPLAFVGGGITLPGDWYKRLVGVVLVVAAARLILGPAASEDRSKSRPPIVVAIALGAIIGLLAGLTGTGGGIFLSPVLLFAGWAGARESGGVAAAFIFVNSTAGLLGNLPSLRMLPSDIWLWVPTVVIGGLLGTELGTRRVATSTFRRLLGVVLVIAGVKLILLL
jgi:uncharacterized membrane protein YfcA